MAKPRQREPWELKAEGLVRDVRNLLDVHGSAIESALALSLGHEQQARARLDQLDALVTALELELWRVAEPNRALGAVLAQGLKGAVVTVLATVTATTATLVTTDTYSALKATEAKADEVIECVIEQEAPSETRTEGRGTWFEHPSPSPRGERQLSSFDDPFYEAGGSQAQQRPSDAEQVLELHDSEDEVSSSDPFVERDDEAAEDETDAGSAGWPYEGGRGRVIR